MIYAILASGTQYVKFGWANSERGVFKRLKGMQTGCPHELVLLGYCDGGAEDEAKLHSSLYESWLRGEWFVRGDQVEFVISQIRSGKPIGEWLSDNNKRKNKPPRRLERIIWWSRQTNDNRPCGETRPA